MKILIVEDYPMNSLILEKILIKEGYEVRVANNGEEGLSRLFASKYDAIITDIMMPKMDGIEFISKIRCNISDPPPILVLTAISSKEIREKALSLGADIYLSKPVSPKEVLDSVEKCIALRNQPINASKINRLEKTHGKSPFIGVFIGASTGGPNALKTLFTDFSYPEADVSFYIVLHGPQWALDTFAESLEKTAKRKVIVVHEKITSKPGMIYLASDKKHLILEPNTYNILLDDGPPENYVKPSIDTMFRSAARCFGDCAIAVVLTGMGCDGSTGALNIFDAGGIVLAEDPKTAVLKSMPEKAVSLGIVKETASIDKLGKIINKYITKLTFKPKFGS